ncbi:MAG TPA: hypothetical protein VNZ57_14265 [Longimicrobiales bacterium]|nr:hypothetical protein [Longimicrobiales bacterium]
MEERDLDLDVPVTPEQWEILARTAEAIGDERGFRTDRNDPPAIHVHLTAERAPSRWRDWISPRDRYGEPERHAARFEFNDGRPVARVDPWIAPEPPAVLPQEVDVMQQDLERWVRNRWHELLEESGIHYVRGHTTEA